MSLSKTCKDGTKITILGKNKDGSYSLTLEEFGAFAASACGMSLANLKAFIKDRDSKYPPNMSMDELKSIGFEEV